MFDKLFGRKRKQPLSASALTEDALRDDIIAETVAEVPRFQTLANEAPTVGDTRWETFGSAVNDVARAAFSFDQPRLRSREEILPSHLFNREILSQVIGSDEFQSARIHTSGNATESLFGAIALGDTMREFAGQAKEHIERSEEASRLEEQHDVTQEHIDRLREQAKQAKDADELAALAERMKQEITDRELIKSNLAKIAQEHAQSNAAAVAAEIAETAGEKVEDAVRVMHLMAGLGPGQSQNLSPEAQIALAERMTRNPQLKEIAERAGRLIRSMKIKRQSRSKNVNIEPVGITTGRDIGRMLPHELARAYMPALRPVWIKDYSERSLLEYKLAGKEPLSKGPIVCVFDGSGSMRGDKIIWAQALNLALLSIAQREKREFAAVQFAGEGKTRSWEFPAGQPVDQTKVLDMIECFLSGGTSIAHGLLTAHDIIKASPKFATADIVLLTDGIVKFGESDQVIVEKLRALDVQIHGIAINAPNNKYLELACDWHCEIADLAAEGDEASGRIATQLS